MDKDYLIRKWLKGDLTDEEKEAFNKLDDYQLNVDIVEDIKHFKASNFSKVSDFDVLDQKLVSKKTPVRHINWNRALLRIASVVIIAFGLYFSFFFSGEHKIETLAGEKKTFELPDTSDIVLNSRSILTYNKKNWSKEREVSLEGEAYFEVAKGATFTVITPGGNVQVLGTKFNVKQRENFFEVECYEGLVKVNVRNTFRKLSGGETLRFIDGEVLSNKTLQSEPEWIGNKSLFNAVPLYEVFAEVERQYDVRIKFEDIDVNRLFSGGFGHKNLENAVKSITTPLGLVYVIENEKLIIIKSQ